MLACVLVFSGITGLERGGRQREAGEELPALISSVITHT